MTKSGAVTVAGTALAAGLLAGCTASGSAPGATASGPSSSTAAEAPTPDHATNTAPASPTATTPAGPPAATASAIGTSTLAPVKAGEPADFGDGLVARVTKVAPEQLTAQGPGEISGPGVVVTISLQNGTSSPVDLDGLTVNATYGDGEVANPHTSPPAAPATGRLAPGASATGAWAFEVPADQASSLQLTITSTSSPNAVVVSR